MSSLIKDSKVLVTGGAGFIGSHLVEKLLNLGVKKVIVLDNLSTGSLDNLKSVWDDTRLSFKEELIQNIHFNEEEIDYVFHLAAEVSVPQSFENPANTYHENVDGFNAVLCHAHKMGAKKIIYASSSAVYGDRMYDKLPEDAPRQPLSPYGVSKQMNEEFALHHWRLFNQSSVGLRFFNVYGSRQRADSPYSGVISIFNRLMKNNTQPTIYGNGNQTRDFVHVSDVVNAMIASIESIEGAKVFNVGTGIHTTINDLYSSLQHLNEFSEKPKYENTRTGDIERSCADINKILNSLDWKPSVYLNEGLKNL